MVQHATPLSTPQSATIGLGVPNDYFVAFAPYSQQQMPQHMVSPTYVQSAPIYRGPPSHSAYRGPNSQQQMGQQVNALAARGPTNINEMMRIRRMLNSPSKFHEEKGQESTETKGSADVSR